MYYVLCIKIIFYIREIAYGDFWLYKSAIERLKGVIV